MESLKIDVEGFKELIAGMASNAVEAEVRKLLGDPRTENANMFLSRKEAAKILGVSFTTLGVWDKSGFLTPCKAGRTLRYPVVEINKLLHRRKAKELVVGN